MRLHDLLDFHARERADKDFAIQGDRRLSYAEAVAEVDRLASAFVGSGLQVGDRVAVLAKNCIEYALIYFAGAKSGAVPVPLNYRLAPAEWAYIINDAGAKMVIAADEYVNAVDSVRGELKTVDRFVVLGAAGQEGWDDFAPWVAGRAATPPARDITDDHDVYQMYTSGTTGHPKGAIVTHGALTSNIEQITMALETSPGERFLIVAPMYHAAAVAATLSCVYRGGCLYIQEDFNPFEVVRALSQENIGLSLLVPAMIQACLVMVPDVAERDYVRAVLDGIPLALRMIVYGASPIAEQTLRRAMQVFKCDFAQAYGMTETTAVLTFLTSADHRRALTEKPELVLSAGRAVCGTDLRVVDENDEDVPAGGIGEIVARGPQLMRGYWNLPEATSEALKGGWMHTGDAGSMDAEGYVYIQDRVKDMIVSGGENVYPRIVEDVLFQHPAVADAAVIGVPHDQWGETVKAIVVLREGQTATEEEILDFCRGRLGGFERPRSVDFIDALPRNPSGKVLKRQLREPYWTGHKRRVAGS